MTKPSPARLSLAPTWYSLGSNEAALAVGRSSQLMSLLFSVGSALPPTPVTKPGACVEPCRVWSEVCKPFADASPHVLSDHGAYVQLGQLNQEICAFGPVCVSSPAH